MDFGSEGFGGSLFPESSDTLLMDSDAVSDSPPILETCNPLVSYFAVCGLDPEAIERKLKLSVGRLWWRQSSGLEHPCMNRMCCRSCGGQATIGMWI